MIIIIGVAGAGKSVQGRLLADTLNCSYFSVGAFLREHREQVDKTAKDKMLSGELLSDDDAIAIIEKSLIKSGVSEKEFILDGFPRTIKQAEWLIDKSKSGELDITSIFHLIASSDVIIGRLLDRHRPDDNMPVINKRIDDYHVTINLIIDKLRRAGMTIHKIDADESIEQVQQAIMKAYKLDN